jgi:hypothetical protein
MDDLNAALEALGYREGPEGWRHPALGLRLHDPGGLLSQPIETLAPLHDPATWADLHPPPPPPMSPALAASLARHGLRWEGWCGAWAAPGGELLPAAAVAAMDAAELDGLAAARAGWEAEQARRNRAGCLGMGAMFLWAALGWLLGQWIWLVGMGAIGLITWQNRPLRRLPAIWEDLPAVDLEGLMDAAAAALPPGWEDLAQITPVLAASPGHLYLPALDLAVSAETLAGFDRAALEAFTAAVAPADSPADSPPDSTVDSPPDLP